MNAKKFTAPRTHTIRQTGRGIRTVYFCTSCCRVIDSKDINKRCKKASGR